MKSNQTKPPLRPIWTLCHLGTIHLTTLLKVMFEFTPGGTPGEITDVELTSLFGGGARHEICTGTNVTAMSKPTTTTRRFTILTNKDWPAVQFRILQFTNGTLSFFGVLVDDNSTAFGSSVVALENVSLVNISNSAHMILQLLPGSFIRKISNINTCITPLMMIVSSTTTTTYSIPSTTTTTKLSTMTMMMMTTTTTTTTRNNTLILFTILPHKNLSPTQFRIIQRLNSIPCSLLIHKLHNPTPLRPSILHHHNFRKLYLPRFSHVIF
mmetsp:Transcript_27243/g.44235  ORF Transcript_27243/g.44235 Transcript_27243/m.44235 type:complete len:268 (+) Transcript_27243:266-1069(+)